MFASLRHRLKGRFSQRRGHEIVIKFIPGVSIKGIGPLWHWSVYESKTRAYLGSGDAFSKEDALSAARDVSNAEWNAKLKRRERWGQDAKTTEVTYL